MVGKIVYEKINRLEAMELIDAGNIKNLYFVEIYYESNYPYGSNGSTFHCVTPGDITQSQPIKYLTEIIVPTGKLFKPYKKIKAEPGQTILMNAYRKYGHHEWVIKKEELQMITNDSFLVKKPKIVIPVVKS